MFFNRNMLLMKMTGCIFKLIVRIKCLHQVFHVHGRIRSPEGHSNVLWANISFKAINVDKLKRKKIINYKQC